MWDLWLKGQLLTIIPKVANSDVFIFDGLGIRLDYVTVKRLFNTSMRCFCVLRYIT